MCKTNVLCNKPKSKDVDAPSKNLKVDLKVVQKICGKDYQSISIGTKSALETMD